MGACGSEWPFVAGPGSESIPDDRALSQSIIPPRATALSVLCQGRRAQSILPMLGFVERDTASLLAADTASLLDATRTRRLPVRRLRTANALLVAAAISVLFAVSEEAFDWLSGVAVWLSAYSCPNVAGMQCDGRLVDVRASRWTGEVCCPLDCLCSSSGSGDGVARCVRVCPSCAVVNGTHGWHRGRAS